MVWKFNASRGTNGVGIVLLVLAIAVSPIGFVNKPANAPPGLPPQMLFGVLPLAVISILLILWKRETIYEDGSDRIVLIKGLRPFLKREEVAVSGSRAVMLTAWRVKGSVCFGIYLRFDSSERQFPITTSGSEKDLKLAVEFAKATGIELIPDAAFQRLGMGYLNRYL